MLQTTDTLEESALGARSLLVDRSELLRQNAALLREVERLRATVARLGAYRQAAFRDSLTDLPNRRYFDERIVEELDRARRYPDQAFSILVIDVNDLKLINDSFGHAAGDLLLQWVAGFINDNVRAHDVCCRMGGDEFLVILPNTSAKDAQHLIARLRRELAGARRRSEGAALAIGAATYGEDGKAIETLFEVADEAMYRDKRRQKGVGAPISRSFRLETVRPTQSYASVELPPAGAFLPPSR